MFTFTVIILCEPKHFMSPPIMYNMPSTLPNLLVLKIKYDLYQWDHRWENYMITLRDT